MNCLTHKINRDISNIVRSYCLASYDFIKETKNNCMVSLSEHTLIIIDRLNANKCYDDNGIYQNNLDNSRIVRYGNWTIRKRNINVN